MILSNCWPWKKYTTAGDGGGDWAYAHPIEELFVMSFCRSILLQTSSFSSHPSYSILLAEFKWWLFGTWNEGQSFVFGSIFYNFLHLWQLFFSIVKGWLGANDVLVNSREQLCSNCETSQQIFGGSFQWFWSGKSLACYWETCSQSVIVKIVTCKLY